MAASDNSHNRVLSEDCSHVGRIERLELSVNEISGNVAEIRFIVAERLPHGLLIDIDRLKQSDAEHNARIKQAEADRADIAKSMKVYAGTVILSALVAIVAASWKQLTGGAP